MLTNDDHSVVHDDEHDAVVVLVVNDKDLVNNEADNGYVNNDSNGNTNNDDNIDST